MIIQYKYIFNLFQIINYWTKEIGMPGKWTFLLVFIITLVTLVTSLCTFPKVMYKTTFHWRIMSPDRNLGIGNDMRTITFSNHSMVVKYIEVSSNTDKIMYQVNYTCSKAYENSLYFIQKQAESQTIQYMCIQFHVRSPNVVQLSFGELKNSIYNSMCEYEQLDLQDAPLVYYYASWVFWRDNYNEGYMTCPLEGAYIVDKWHHQGVNRTTNDCMNILHPLVLSNECDKGEGMQFISSVECEWPSHLLSQQPYFCIASWDHEVYTYMVVVQTYTDNIMPCFRYPQGVGAKMRALMFLDGICDSSDVLATSEEYVQFDLTKHTTPTLCSDGLPLCTAASIDCNLEQFAICRDTCASCQSGNVTQTIALPKYIQGKWLKDTYLTSKEEIEIGTTEIFIPSLGRYKVMAESSCTRDSLAEFSWASKEYILSLVIDNGCFPRVTRIQFFTQGDGVLSYRMSLSQIVKFKAENTFLKGWKPALVNTWADMCRFLDYKEHNPVSNGRFKPIKEGWFNLVMLESAKIEIRVPTPCNYPFMNYHFNVLLQAGPACEGTMTAPSRYQMKLNIDVCHNSQNTTDYIMRNAITRHLCLARLYDQKENIFIITKQVVNDNSILDSMDFVCWLFQPGHKHVYLLPISSCDSNTMALIIQQRIIPIAIFTYTSNPEVLSNDARCHFIDIYLVYFLLFCIVQQCIW